MRLAKSRTTTAVGGSEEIGGNLLRVSRKGDGQMKAAETGG